MHMKHAIDSNSNMLLIPMDTNKNKTYNALDTDTNGDEMNIKLKTRNEHKTENSCISTPINLLPLFINHQQRGKNKKI